MREKDCGHGGAMNASSRIMRTRTLSDSSMAASTAGQSSRTSAAAWRLRKGRQGDLDAVLASVAPIELGIATPGMAFIKRRKTTWSVSIDQQQA